ncbi:ribonuclease H-like domain-containing protein [Bythopirellula polymerisocia]|uniref:YprB ribonuclease H-like domain-containing protein n=1 Tax=Bythopirellula polymerisocia TaxID=2528003 RepID=A0A5C6CFD3_9BACT|nr:ribonuclease H-like domain-containing protein [Bythopirellula polymerisocia]TWU22725.1 hypothetical protein Pla144_41860 [Bythopirellula polymerisocia]
MINEALKHCPGIGPVRLAKLHSEGISTWQDVMQYPQRIPAGCRFGMIEEIRRCFTALEHEDIQYFIDHLASADKWRILANYLDDATFFDIETLGLSSADPITVIVTWYQGKFSTFVEHENLDDFLNLLDQVKLLVSFNGSTFDVPRVLDAFHIPSLPCPHLDLRWMAYHRGLAGGMKQIANSLGIVRPADIADVTGEQAILLWQAWIAKQDHAAREHLIRYCAADVLLSRFLAERLVGKDEIEEGKLWDTLPPIASRPTVLTGFTAQPPKPNYSPHKRSLKRKRLLLSMRWA